MTDERTTVIVLNGVGSAGKTSAARALQSMAETPFLHVAMDDFIGMLPERLMGHPDGLVFAAAEHAGAPIIHVRTGPVMARTMRGMRHAIAALAAQGNHLIVDDVMFDASEAAEYRRLLGGCDLRLVGLFAPLAVLEQREMARGDRAIGLARGQMARVHRGIGYDLEIDTSAMSAAEVAGAICSAFGVRRIQ
jgi:chloramphenicol 3-O phosphotransferase